MDYNTEATFDFDSKKMKLKYDGKEDEIIKLLEAGNAEMEGKTRILAAMLVLCKEITNFSCFYNRS